MALMGGRYFNCALMASVLSLAASVLPGAPAQGRPGAKAVSSLSVAAAPVGTFDRDFNPFASGQATVRDGVVQFLYEPLLEYDGAQYNQYYPWLASSWTFSTSGQNITFDLRPGARWDDGSPLTAADVAYTFDLVKQHPSLAEGLPLVSAVASGPSTVTLTLSRPAYGYLYQIAHVPIVKSGYGDGTKDIATYIDRSPDGTGPYRLASGGFSKSKVVLEARAHYWQGAPGIDRLVFPALADDQAVSGALTSGRLDWAQLFMPDAGSFVSKDRTRRHFWFTPDSCTALVLDFLARPFGQLAVRRAISNALDRSAISAAASGGFEPPAADSSGLVLPRDAQFLPPGGAGTLATHSRPQATARIMRAAGYRRAGTGPWHDPAGHPVRLGIIAPAGTPLAAMATTVAAQLRSAGFSASATGLSAAKWSADLADGNFQGAIVPGPDEPSPYFEYQAWLSTSALQGTKANGGDFERLDSATAPSTARAAQGYLARYSASAPGSPAGSAALRALAALAASDLPVIPLVYGVAWGEYSTGHVSGWPGAADPYEPAVPEPPLGEYTVLQLSAGP